MKDIDIVLQEKENARILLTAFQTILDHSIDLIFVKDMNLNYLAVTTPFAQMVGKQRPEEVIGLSDMDVFEDKDLATRYASDDRKMFASGKDLKDFIEPIPGDNGHARYGNTSKYILRNNQGDMIGLLGVTRDVTKDIMAQQNHQRELEYLFELPEDAYAAVFIDVHDWRIVGERRQTVEEVSIPVYDSIDMFLEHARRYVDSSSEAAYPFFANMSQESLRAIYESGKRNVTLEYTRTMQDQKLHWVKTEITFLTDPDNNHLYAMIVIRDIDPEKQAEEQILQAAEIDEMTGLLNRAATMKYINRFLAESDATASHALLIIDVDNFKEVNDTYGHQEGDKFLIRLAQAIKGSFRSSDIVGRIGGDEFFVLMKDVPSRELLAEKTDALLKAMQTVCEGYDAIRVSGSVGVCLYSSGTLDQLYARADAALYRAKREGKNRVVYADEV